MFEPSRITALASAFGPVTHTTVVRFGSSIAPNFSDARNKSSKSVENKQYVLVVRNCGSRGALMRIFLQQAVYHRWPLFEGAEPSTRSRDRRRKRAVIILRNRKNGAACAAPSVTAI